VVISGRASAEAVVKIHEANAQPVSSTTTAGPLGAPDLRSSHDYRLWPTRWRGSERLRQHAKTKQHQKHAYEDSQTGYINDIQGAGFSNLSSVHNLFPFSLGLP
jgi:hypothetical protein